MSSMLFSLIVVAIVVVVILAMVIALKRKAPPAVRADIYNLRSSLLTPAERSFLGVIDPLLPPEVRVCPKVRLEDFLSIKKGLGRSANQAARNRINRKHVDFLLVRATDFTPLAGIELDDRSHDAEDRKERDAFVDTAFASAKLPLLHVSAAATYHPAELRTKLATVLNAA